MTTRYHSSSSDYKCTHISAALTRTYGTRHIGTNGGACGVWYDNGGDWIKRGHL